MKATILLVLCVFMTSVNTFAHPGHDFFSGEPVVHYLTDPYHILIGVGTLAVTLFLVFKKKSSKRQSTVAK